MLLLQTLNEIIDVGPGSDMSDHENENIFENNALNERPELMMDEYTQTQVESTRILFDIEVQTVEDTWEMKYFKLNRENEMIKNDIKTYELEKSNIIIKFEDKI